MGDQFKTLMLFPWEFQRIVAKAIRIGPQLLPKWWISFNFHSKTNLANPWESSFTYNACNKNQHTFWGILGLQWSRVAFLCQIYWVCTSTLVERLPLLLAQITSNIQSQGFHQVCNIHLQKLALFHVQVDAMQYFIFYEFFFEFIYTIQSLQKKNVILTNTIHDSLE